MMEVAGKQAEKSQSKVERNDTAKDDLKTIEGRQKLYARAEEKLALLESGNDRNDPAKQKMAMKLQKAMDFLDREENAKDQLYPEEVARALFNTLERIAKASNKPKMTDAQADIITAELREEGAKQQKLLKKLI